MTSDSLPQRIARHTGGIIAAALIALGVVGLVVLIVGAITGNAAQFNGGGTTLTAAILIATPYGIGYAAAWRRHDVRPERLAAIETSLAHLHHELQRIEHARTVQGQRVDTQLGEVRGQLAQLDEVAAVLTSIEETVDGISTVRQFRRGG